MSLTYLEIEGGQLAVELREPPTAAATATTSARLIVASPSLGDTRDAFYPLVDALVAAGFRVALADLRGHGDSSTGFTRYGDEATAADLLAVTEHFAKGGDDDDDDDDDDKVKVLLMGSSLSSAAATIAAAQMQPAGRLAGLVLISPFLRSGVSEVVRSLMNVLFWRPWGPAVWRMYVATLWPGLSPEERTRRAATTTAALTAKPGGWAAFQATLAGADHTGMVTPWLAKARKAAPAVLVVAGEKDPDYGSAREEVGWVVGRFTEPGPDPVRVLMMSVISEAGHAPMLERAEEVIEEVRQFLHLMEVNGVW